MAESGREIVVTKRGKPVAKLGPVEPPKLLKGSVRILGDIISPLEDEWDAANDSPRHACVAVVVIRRGAGSLSGGA